MQEALDGSRDLKTVARYLDPEEAHIAAGWLERSGLHPSLADVHTVGMLSWLAAPIVGGVRLQLPSEEEANGLELLGPEQAAIDEQIDQESDVVADAAESSIPCCPLCGSRSVHRERLSRRLVFASLLIIWFFVYSLWVIVPLLVLFGTPARWKCRNPSCLHDWPADAERSVRPSGAETAEPATAKGLSEAAPRTRPGPVRSRAAVGAVIGGLVGYLTGIADYDSVILQVGAGAAIGWFLGRISPYRLCPGASCGAKLALDADECVRCGWSASDTAG